MCSYLDKDTYKFELGKGVQLEDGSDVSILQQVDGTEALDKEILDAEGVAQGLLISIP